MLPNLQGGCDMYDRAPGGYSRCVLWFKFVANLLSLFAVLLLSLSFLAILVPAQLPAGARSS